MLFHGSGPKEVQRICMTRAASPTDETEKDFWTRVGKDARTTSVQSAVIERQSALQKRSAQEVETRAGSTRIHAAAVRLIAFYLPQFHPISENNEWWGAGFTEWTNVAKAKPLYRGHRQPNLPADLGFYDLRVPEVREQQAEFARSAGVEGFCYWHYWFGCGRRILERPFDEVLATGKPDFPFCIAWANQPWTGVWHGMPRYTLVDQTYPGEDDFRAHFNLLLPAFRDRRYMRVDGKPIFIVYDPNHLRETCGFVDFWQKLAQEAGLPGIFFVGMSNQDNPELLAPFDMLANYGPGSFLDRLPRDLLSRSLRALKRCDLSPVVDLKMAQRFRQPARYAYRDVVEAMMKIPLHARYAPCVLPNWDNTPRSGARGVVFENSTPEMFQSYLAHACEQVASRPAERRIVFLKARNEWAEGNYVEPDARFGHRYLDAVRSVVMREKV
jgi:hypothetical protein